MPKPPEDPAIAVLIAAAERVRNVLDNECDKIADDIRRSRGTYLDDTLPDEPDQIDEKPWENPDHHIANAAHQFRHDSNLADNAHEDDRHQAESDLRNALSGWTKALEGYHNAVGQARTALDDAVRSEHRSYSDDHRWHQKSDTLGRNAHVYMTRRDNAAQALQAYEAALAAASNALSGQIGALYSAYATYAGAMTRAEAARLLTKTAAQLAFWGAAEDVWKKE